MTAVLVIGCGVSGLSCAIRLREEGFDAHIIARSLPPDTTSNVAAAIWYPYNAFPKERVNGWGEVTYARLQELVGDPATGVLVREGREIFPEPVDDPWWKDAVPSLRRARADELPSGYVDGYVFDAPLIEMPIYLRYLIDRFQRLGGTITQQALSTLEELPDTLDLLVNCSGLGSRELLGDRELYPIRGQVVRVAQIGLERFWLDDYGPHGVTYIIPRLNDIILGGTADEGDENLTPDMNTAWAIVERCALLEPSLRQAAILEHRVGLRPGRTAVRLQAETLASGRTVIHNYGHGGAGVTLSWGCAEEVLSLAQYLA